MICAEKGLIDIVSMLLEKGAAVERVNKVRDTDFIRSSLYECNLLADVRTAALHYTSQR